MTCPAPSKCSKESFTAVATTTNSTLADIITKKLQLQCDKLQFVFSDSNNIAFGAAIPEFDDKDGGIYTSSPYKMVSLFEKHFKEENTVFVYRDTEIQKSGISTILMMLFQSYAKAVFGKFLIVDAFVVI